MTKKTETEIANLTSPTVTPATYLTIQNQENGDEFAAMMFWDENGTRRFCRATDFTTDKNLIDSFVIAANAATKKGFSND